MKCWLFSFQTICKWWLNSVYLSIKMDSFLGLYDYFNKLMYCKYEVTCCLILNASVVVSINKTICFTVMFDLCFVYLKRTWEDVRTIYSIERPCLMSSMYPLICHSPLKQHERVLSSFMIRNILFYSLLSSPFTAKDESPSRTQILQHW